MEAELGVSVGGANSSGAGGVKEAMLPATVPRSYTIPTHVLSTRGGWMLPGFGTLPRTGCKWLR